MFRPSSSQSPRRLVVQPVPPIDSSPASPADAKIRYDLLWRKKSTKMHKTWEGDAIGVVSRSNTNPDYVMKVKADGLHLATFKLGPDFVELKIGLILAAGSYEVEVSGLRPVSRGSKLSSPAPNVSAGSGTTPLKAPLKSPAVSAGQGVLPKLRSSNHATPPKTAGQFNTPFSTPFMVPKAALVKIKIESESEGEKGTKSSTKRQTADPVGEKRAKLATTLRNPPPPVPVRQVFQPHVIKTEPTATKPLLPSLRSHQIEAVEFMKNSLLGTRHRYGRGCILADEMGLGKTLAAIALVQNLLAEGHVRNALIVCPVTLVANWRAEFRKWLPPQSNLGVMVIDKQGLGNGGIKDPATAFFNDPKFRTHQVLIVGYERVRLMAAALAQAGRAFDAVVCDEGHRLKSSGSQTTEAIASISGDLRVILTGTPIQNDLREFWALAEFVNPGMLGTEAKFARKYAQPIQYVTERKAEGDDANKFEEAEELSDLGDLTNLSDLSHISQSQSQSKDPLREQGHEALADLTEICDEIMLRRRSDVIAQYLAVPKAEHVVFCRPTARQLAQYAEVSATIESLWGGVAGGVDPQTCLKTISDLRKIAAGGMHGERGGKLELLGRLLDALSKQTDEKIVIVSGSTRVLDLCRDLLVSKRLNWLRLDGQTPPEKRQSSVRIFNQTAADAAFAFLLSSRSGGMGLNLVGASRLVLLDCDWNPAVDVQAMARIHRDGQKRPCHIYRFLSTGTIDEKIFQRQLSKIGLSNNVLLESVGASKVTRGDFTPEALRDLFTLTEPEKCSTLDALGKQAGVRGYAEVSDVADAVLVQAMAEANNVSCVMRNTANPESDSNIVSIDPC